MNRRALLLGTVVLSALTTAAAQDAATAPALGYKDSYQVSVVGNLQVADSVINLTNAGVHQSTGSFFGGGYICANVYVHDPTGQMVACCSCPVVKDGIRSFSAVTDLISNTLTPAVPSSVVIKIVSTIPVGGDSAPQTCDAGKLTPNLAPPFLPLGTAGGFASGLRATSTHIHSMVGPPTATIYGTETAFQQVPLSPEERSGLTTKCAQIQANGSDFGICHQCRVGAQ